MLMKYTDSFVFVAYRENSGVRRIMEKGLKRSWELSSTMIVDDTD